MSEPTPRTRVYPTFARVSFLVYGLIISIAIFFVSTFVAYLARYVFGGQARPLTEFPIVLWFSTGFLLVGSHLLWRSEFYVRREKQSAFRLTLTAAFVCAAIFCVLQGLGMHQLTELHLVQGGSFAAAALMIFLHVAHFVAGFIALGVVTVKAYQGRYDHEYYNGVRLSAVYWRFLDVIWLLMLLLFVATGWSAS